MTKGRGTTRRVARLGALAAALSVIGASAIQPAAAASSAPAPRVHVQSDRSVLAGEPVRVTITRLSAARPVTIAWGDGSRTRVTGQCRPDVARRHPSACSARVRHAYAQSGTFPVVVSRAPWSAYRTVFRVAASAAAPADQPSAAPAPDGAWQEQMLARVNALRSAAGVPALVLCARLAATAQDYATLMATTGHYGHVGPDGSQPWDRMSAHGYQWREAAENIAAGFNDVDAVMTGWRNSPGHYANIISPTLEHVGFGSATNPSSIYGNYWVQNFGRGGTCS